MIPFPIRLKALIISSSLTLFLLSSFAQKPETPAWEKNFPENEEDLLEIQAKLRKLIALTKHTLVSIEAGDGAGSGVIISEDGLVLTAAHVIGKTGKKMHIRMHDGRRIPAVSLGGSELSDAGMLKITRKSKWPFADMANSGSSQVGDWCYGLGHPGGFDLERGIVVRIGRIISKKEETMQTDSRLLGGDSGGPLFNFEGKVIAIHSRISSEPDQNFHVPIESFRANWDFFLKEKLLTLESLGEGGFLGVACEETEMGLTIKSVIKGSVAENAGLKENDLLLKLDDQPIMNREKLTIFISSKSPGTPIKVEFQRGDAVASMKIKLGSRND